MSAQPNSQLSVMLGFQVDDVGAEFARLEGSKQLPIQSVLQPTTLNGATDQSTFVIPTQIPSISSRPTAHSAQLALRHSGMLAQMASRFAIAQLC